MPAILSHRPNASFSLADIDFPPYHQPAYTCPRGWMDPFASVSCIAYAHPSIQLTQVILPAEFSPSHPPTQGLKGIKICLTLLYSHKLRKTPKNNEIRSPYISPTVVRHWQVCQACSFLRLPASRRFGHGLTYPVGLVGLRTISRAQQSLDLHLSRVNQPITAIPLY